jgi:tetratricopeptide (TPR) repeat protein
MLRGYQIRRLRWWTGVFAFGSLIAACGGASNGVREDSERSIAEMRLAAGMRQERNIPSALQHYQRALELDEGNAEAHLQLGHLYLTEPDYGDFKKAEHHLKEALRLQREDDTVRRGIAPEVQTMLGALYINQNRYQDAVKVLEDAIADIHNSQPHFAWGNLGWAHYEHEHYKEAEKALLRAVQLQPRFCVGHYRLGQTYVALKNYERAEQALSHAIESDTRCKSFFQEAWRLRGETRAQLGHRDEAIGDFERCVEIAKTTPAGKSCQRYLEASQ